MRRLLIAAVALALLSGCAGDRTARGVLLVTLDTTRADRLGCYGYPDGGTRNLDKLASVGVRFDQCVSPVPITLPAHASIFTGAYPAVHGVRYNGMFRLTGEAVTLAEILRDAGWRTAGFPAGYPVAEATGLAQGFETYLDLFSSPKQGAQLAESQRIASEVSHDAIAWLDGVGDAPFFAWVHFYDPHEPYEPPEPYRSRFPGRPYDGEIAFADNELGRIFQALGASGRWDDTLVVVVGDHGEGLGDHREPTHKNLVYETTLRVPLLVKPPGRVRASVVAEPVSLIDLPTTILEYAGLAPPKSFEGTGLRSAIEGRSPPRRPLFFESLAGSLSFGWAPLEGVRRGPFKLIDGPGRELYDLESDPGETDNLADMNPGVADDLAAELEAERARWAGSGGAAAAVEQLDRESRERLESLGYLGGSMTRSTKVGRNPRDVAHLETPIEDGKRRMKARDWTGALASFRVVLAEDPDNRYALGQAAEAALATRDFDAALDWAKRQTEVYPDSVEALQLLGDVRFERGERAEAAAAAEAALAKRPGDPGLHYRLVLTRLLAGDARGALSAADEAIAAEPGVPHPNVLMVAAAAKARLGDAAAASRTLARAVDEGFRNPEAIASDEAFAPLRALPDYRRLFGP